MRKNLKKCRDNRWTRPRRHRNQDTCGTCVFLDGLYTYQIIPSHTLDTDRPRVTAHRTCSDATLSETHRGFYRGEEVMDRETYPESRGQKPENKKKRIYRKGDSRDEGETYGVSHLSSSRALAMNESAEVYEHQDHQVRTQVVKL